MLIGFASHWRFKKSPQLNFFLNPSANIAFENGQPVLTCDPEIFANEEKRIQELIAKAKDEGKDEATRDIFRLLLAGHADAIEAGLRAHLLAFVAECHPSSPENQRELAQVVGMSQSAVSKGIKAQCDKSPDFAMVFGRLNAHNGIKT